MTNQCNFTFSPFLRSLSDFSWPQAAKISRPRGVRMGEENPASLRMRPKAWMRLFDEHSYGAPGHGLNGIKFTLAWIPLSNFTNSRASVSESFTPLSMTYSNVMRRALLAAG